MFKHYLEGKKAVFFDMDGTLVDTEPLWNQAIIEVLKPMEFDFIPVDKLPVGTYIGTKWQYMLEEYEIKTPLTIEQLNNQTYEQLIKLIRADDEFDARDGFWDLIAELKDKNLITALVSNSDRVVVNAILDKLNLKTIFDLTLAGNEVKRRKPDPDIYVEAAKQLKLKAHEVLVFEDSVTGAHAASKAHMDMVIIWQQEVSHKRYPGHIFGFLPNFENIAGNLDLTYTEKFDKEAPKFLQFVQDYEKNLDDKYKLYTQ